MRDFHELLPHASIVTLIPMQKPENAERIERLNARIRLLVEARALPVIDLNPLAQDGALKAEYTTDSLHFSDAGVCAMEAGAKARHVSSLRRIP